MTVLSLIYLIACGSYQDCDGTDESTLMTVTVDTTQSDPIVTWDNGSATYVAFLDNQADAAWFWAVQCDGNSLETRACISSPYTYGSVPGDSFVEGCGDCDPAAPKALESGVEYIVKLLTYTASDDDSCGNGHTGQATFTMP